MNFTFGIITDGTADINIKQIISSIKSDVKNEYEIIIVGNSKIQDIQVVKFDETIKPAWITKKKNIITELAKYDNIVYIHDYIKFCSGWYDGFLKFGDNFDVCMTKLITPSNKRYRDWTLDCMLKIDHIIDQSRRYERLLPYEETDLSKYMYISGAYMVCKKEVMKKYPLNENLTWGQSEDVFWSMEIRKQYDFSINQYSTAQLLKEKDPSFIPIKNDFLNKLKNLTIDEKQVIENHAEVCYNRIKNDFNIT